MPRVTTAYREAMRERLLAAAASVVVQRGYDGTTMRDILSEADVAPSTLYAYFKGKEEIVRALTERALASLEAVAQVDDDSAERLFSWALRSTMARPFPAGAVLAELRSRSTRGRGAAAARRLNKTVVSLWSPLISRLQASDAIRVTDPEAFLELLDIVNEGMARRAAARTFATSFERVGEACLDALAQGAVPSLVGDERRDERRQ